MGTTAPDLQTMNWFLSMTKMVLPGGSRPLCSEGTSCHHFLSASSFKVGAKDIAPTLKREKSLKPEVPGTQSCPELPHRGDSGNLFDILLYSIWARGQQGFSQSTRSTGIRPGHKHLPADSPTLSVVFLLTSLAICCTLHFHCVLTITIFQGISLVFSPGCCQFLMGDFHWVPSIL